MVEDIFTSRRSQSTLKAQVAATYKPLVSQLKKKIVVTTALQNPIVSDCSIISSMLNQVELMLVDLLISRVG